MTAHTPPPLCLPCPRLAEAFAAFIAAYNSLDDRAVLLYRLKALALQCLDTLVRHRCADGPRALGDLAEQAAQHPIWYP